MAKTNSEDPSIVRLGFFPNTGHQYVFLPFVDDPKAKFSLKNVPKSLVAFCRSEEDPWKECFQSDGTPLAWVRWRFGRREEEVGIWVVVETNLGTRSRGGLFRAREKAGTSRVVEGNNFSSPYYRKRVEDLPPSDDREQEELLKFSFHESVVPEKFRKLASNRPMGGSMGISATDSMAAVAAAGGITLPEIPGISSAPPPPPLPASTHVAGAESPSGESSAPRVIQELAIWWPRRTGHSWDVDLIVDFGNSRSVALLLEEPNTNVGDVDRGFHDIIRPVRFMPRGRGYEASKVSPGDDPMAILDTWFILHETMFSDFDPPNMDESRAMEEPHVEEITRKGSGLFGKPVSELVIAETTLRVPQMFAELAPCVVGRDAIDAFGRLDFQKGHLVYQSSPKRYAWDTDPVANEFWGMSANSWSSLAALDQMPQLAAYVLSYMYERCLENDDAAEDWPITSPPQGDPVPGRRPSPKPMEPAYARCDTIVWMALNVLETAYRQLTSNCYREEMGNFIPRRLKSVSVTFPSGWTGKELRNYRRKWQTAINIFAHAHFDQPEKDGTRNEEDKVVPELHMEVDEGLASQLPIVYGEIRRMGNVGENWLELVGKPRQGPYASARIMTVDIGGGTTDYSILDYEDRTIGVGVDLHSTLLYKDSSPIAGDLMVRRILEEILLPQIGRRSEFSDDKDQMRVYADLFKRNKRRGRELEEWKRLLRLFFLPIVNEWLKRWSAGRLHEPIILEGISGLDIRQINVLNRIGREEGLKYDIWSEGAEVLDFSNEKALEAVVRETFGYLFRSLAKLVPVFGVDLVVLTGKPSELPAVKNLLEETMTLPANRILPVKDFPIGEWYPFKRFGRISDAKTVTACGAALYRALKRSMVPGWNGIKRRTASTILRSNCWMTVLPPGSPKNARVTYLDNGMFREFQEESGWIDIPIGTRIGRSMLPGIGDPDPIYILRWRDPERNRGITDRKEWGNAHIFVRLKRVGPEVQDGGAEIQEPEYLEMISAKGEVVLRKGTAEEEKIEIGLNDVELKLCTLENGEYWVDSASLSINIETGPQRGDRPAGARRRRARR